MQRLNTHNLVPCTSSHPTFAKCRNMLFYQLSRVSSSHSMATGLLNAAGCWTMPLSPFATGIVVSHPRNLGYEQALRTVPRPETASPRRVILLEPSGFTECSDQVVFRKRSLSL